MFPGMTVVPRIGAELASELIETRQLEVRSAFCAGARRRHSYVRGLFRVLTSSGAANAALACERCGEGRSWVAHDLLRRHHIAVAVLPLLDDMRRIYCERCGALGAQNHHWAPQALFRDDADDWPQAFLCEPCHQRWHQTTRTA